MYRIVVAFMITANILLAAAAADAVEAIKKPLSAVKFNQSVATPIVLCPTGWEKKVLTPGEKSEGILIGCQPTKAPITCPSGYTYAAYAGCRSNQAGTGCEGSYLGCFGKKNQTGAKPPTPACPSGWVADTSSAFDFGDNTYLVHCKPAAPPGDMNCPTGYSYFADMDCLVKASKPGAVSCEGCTVGCRKSAQSNKPPQK